MAPKVKTSESTNAMKALLSLDSLNTLFDIIASRQEIFKTIH
jgi:hypothetical protein